jgi:hypothetical protein
MRFRIVKPIDEWGEMFACRGTPSHESHDTRHEQGCDSGAPVLVIPGEVARTDNFCRHCGMWSPLHQDESIHVRLVSIEKLLLKTILGVGAVWLLVGWIVLQMFHFDIYHR